jgi:hypothetical protein
VIVPPHSDRSSGEATSAAIALGVPVQSFAQPSASSNATLLRCATEMLRGLDCIQRTPSSSQVKQNRPRMSAEGFEKKLRL